MPRPASTASAVDLRHGADDVRPVDCCASTELDERDRNCYAPALVGQGVEPEAGIEPATYRLRGDCSATELLRHVAASDLGRGPPVARKHDHAAFGPQVANGFRVCQTGRVAVVAVGAATSPHGTHGRAGPRLPRYGTFPVSWLRRSRPWPSVGRLWRRVVLSLRDRYGFGSIEHTSRA